MGAGAGRRWAPDLEWAWAPGGARFGKCAGAGGARFGKGSFVVEKAYVPEGQTPPASQVGATLEALASTIAARRDAGEESYTHRLLTGPSDTVLKKVMEESGEVALAAKDVEAQIASAVAVAAAAVPAADATGAYAARDVSAAAAGLVVELPDEYDRAVDHLRYEAADVVYHLLVVLERYGIGIDEFAAELNERMTDAERPEGAVRLTEGSVNRGR